MEHLTNAWEIVKEQLVGWIIYGLVFSCTMAAFGLGILLAPNAIRGAQRAIQSREAPEIGDLFNFDNIADDAVSMILFGIGVGVGALACGVGAIATGTLLFWVPFLAAEGRYKPLDTLKASAAHAKGNFVEVLIVSLVTQVLLGVVSGVSCGLLSILVAPIVGVAWCLFYNINRDAIAAAAQADMIAMK